MMSIPAFQKSVNFKKALFLLLIFAILLVLFFASSYLSKALQKSAADEFNRMVLDRDYRGLEKFTHRIGIDKSYGLLKEKFPGNEPQGHDFAHVIGIAAYQKEKTAGLLHCDSAYNYGCFHGYMESFVAQNGIDKIPQVENACISLGTLHAPSCLHGIGHGAMIDAGYVLGKALESCHLLQNSSQTYCFDGVFMERIVQSMRSPEKKFPITLETLDYPCSEVAYLYKSQCWRNQVTVWFSFYGGESRNSGQRCLMVEPEFRSICLESVGLNIAMLGPRDVNFAVRGCAFIPEDIVSDECVIGVLKELMFENKSLDVAEGLCGFVSASTRTGCQQLYGQLKNDNQMRFGATVKTPS